MDMLGTEQLELLADREHPGAAGFPIGCAEDGRGRPTVLLHCSGADRAHWDRLIGAWTARATEPRRFLRPEFFGCGQTARWPGWRPIALQDHVRLVGAAVESIDEPFDLIGHSFGGAVALVLAKTMPERLRSLTLIEPSAFFLLKEDRPEAATLLAEIAKLGQAVRQGAAAGGQGCHDGMRYFVDYWNVPGRWSTLPLPVRQAIAEKADVTAQEFGALFNDRMRLADCRTIAIPTLLIGGSRSPTPVRHILCRLAETMPFARQVCIPDAAHMIPLTHAEVLADLLGRRSPATRRRA